MVAIFELGAILNNYANDQYQQTWVEKNFVFAIALVLFALGVASVLEVFYLRRKLKSRIPNAAQY